MPHPEFPESAELAMAEADRTKGFSAALLRADLLAALGERGLALPDPGIRVAILDGPVSTRHRAFGRATLEELDLGPVSAEGKGGPAAAHGTLVASVILGDDGLAPDAYGFSIPIYGQDHSGQVRPATQGLLARAIHLALDHGAQLINISGGEHVPSGQAGSELELAIARARRDNVLVVAAAGNDGCECLHVPGALPSVLPVGAADGAGRPLPSSNWGGPYRTGGLLAPGEEIEGAALRGGVEHATGSSFAAAVVTGVAAFLLGAQRAAGRRPDPHGIRMALLQSAIRCNPSEEAECHRHLVGNLDPRAALALVLQGVEPMNETPQSASETSGLGAPSAAPTSAAPTSAAPASAPLSAIPASSLSGIQSASAASAAGGVVPSGCACEGNGGLVYVLGQIDYDFGTLENYSWFEQNAKVGGKFVNPNNPEQLLAYLDANPEFSSSVVWTVTIAGVPVYAIDPEDCDCQAVYRRLRKFLAHQLEAASRGSNPTPFPKPISTIPARVHGTQALLDGSVVPKLVPDPRGMFNFELDEIESSLQDLLESKKALPPSQKEALRAYLEYLVYKMRNLGRAPADRARNYLAVQGIHALFASAFGRGQTIGALAGSKFDEFRLSSADAAPSPFCRPGGECLDVSLVFFDPTSAVDTAPVVFRQTVDVAAVNPVLVGEPAHYRVR